MSMGSVEITVDRGHGARRDRHNEVRRPTSKEQKKRKRKLGGEKNVWHHGD